MKSYNFTAQQRQVFGKAVKNLRQQSLVPGVVYGDIKENINIQMDSVKLEKLYNEAGESSIINLQIEGEKEPMEVLIKDVSYDPLLMKINHIDFYKIKRGQKIDAAVGIKFINQSPAVKELGGVLVEALDEVEIRCLPKDLIAEIKVDLSVLKTFDDSVYVKDLKVPAEVEILASLDEVVASVIPPREEEIEEKAPEAEMPEAEGEQAPESEAGKKEAASEEKAPEQPEAQEKKQ